MTRDQVFISYSHKDKKWLERLQVMLAPLKRKAKIKVWADTQIDPGKKWKEEIQRALKSTKVAVLLVSPDFLASEFIHTNELPSLLTAAEKEGLTILWVLVSDCAYQLTIIADYQAAYSLDRPLDYLRPAQQKTALVKIVTRIEKAWSSSPSSKPVNPAIMMPQVPPPKSKPPPEPAEPITGLRDQLQDGSMGPKMAWLPGGVFQMGQDDSPYDDEKPAHEVAVSAFSIGQYPVTFEEYDKFCEATRREKPDDYSWGRGTRPAIDISWSNAAAYCEWLSQQTGERYRLPTEAEWEYACRAGSTTRYCFGDDKQRVGEYAWYSSNARGQTHPVGEKLPNAWQLYDLYGNVWEWVQDWYGDYSKEPQHDPSGPESGSSRVLRGGCWSRSAAICRSAYRLRSDPGGRSINLGFRLARTGTWLLDALTLGRRPVGGRKPRVPPPSEPEPRYQPYQGFQDHLKDDTVAPEMIYLPGGTFRMGDIQGEGSKWERPVHEVTLDAFAVGRYPVTVGEFRRFVEVTGYRTDAEREDGAYVWDGGEWSKKSDASWRNPYFSQADRHPVVCISWNDAATYCEWLSEQTGEPYSLPMEAEWEYACRASSETAYFFGDDEKRLEDYAWYSKNSEGRTHPVGERRANAWGLYDLHGNVWEWVQDWYGDYSEEPQHDPSGPESSALRVFRGGGWLDAAGSCRSAYRGLDHPGLRGFDLGFRLARRVQLSAFTFLPFAAHERGPGHFAGNVVNLQQLMLIYNS